MDKVSLPGLATKCWMRYGQKWPTSFKMQRQGSHEWWGRGGSEDDTVRVGTVGTHDMCIHRWVPGVEVELTVRL